MNLRKAAEGLAEELDTAAHWIESCPFENAIPHAHELRQRSDSIREALSQPDTLAEAVELLQEWYMSYSIGQWNMWDMKNKTIDFLRRYYAVQQKQSDRDESPQHSA